MNPNSVDGGNPSYPTEREYLDNQTSLKADIARLSERLQIQDGIIASLQANQSQQAMEIEALRKVVAGLLAKANGTDDIDRYERLLKGDNPETPITNS